MTITDEAPEAPAAPSPRGTPQLNAALADFQAEMPSIAKGETGEVSGVTKEGKPFHYKYNYADLGAISVAAYPVLGKHGLSFSAQPTVVDGKFVLAYQLRHKSGEEIAGLIFLPSQTDPQKLGSVLTYYRRYALCAITGIAPGGDDDDAQSSNTVQQFDRYESAGAAFDRATPAPPRRQQQDRPPQPERPAQQGPVTVPPLEPEDPWKIKIEDIADAQEGAAVRAEVAELLETGAIDQERANRLNAVITVRGLELVAAQGGSWPGSRPPAESPPPIRAEDQGARRPAQAEAADDAAWVEDFTMRLAEADRDALGGMQREVGQAVAARKIQADTAGELAAAIRVRRNSLSAPVPA